jgi:chromosome segregation protein
VAVAASVRLRRLEVQGFKSFATRTAFDFGPGITAIVGPNGSGKSNLADALRWVLGEQNPRALRLRRLEDVIFAGGGKRAQSGLAEVSIVLDNADGWLPIEYNEVVVTRRLHRSGESEYLINRRRVRLRDILDLFLKARLGQNSYAILGQGMVDMVLSLRPDERRTLIEEAADVRRHRLKIDEATDQLAATRDNRDRVELLLAEITPRLAQLERQARRAAEHAAHSRDLATSLQLLYGVRLRSGYAFVGQSRVRLEAARAEAEQSCRTLQSAEQRMESLRQESEQAASILETAEAEWRQAKEEMRSQGRALRELRERMPMLDRRVAETKQELASLQQEALALENAAPQDAATSVSLQAADEAIASAQEVLRAAAQRAERAKGELSRREHEHRAARQHELERVAQTARLEGDLRRLEQERLKLGQRRRTAVDRLKAWASGYRDALSVHPDLERRLQNVRNSLVDASRRARSIATALGQAERELLQLDTDLQQGRRRLAVLEHERDARRPTEDVIVALLDALRGGGPGRPRVLGILGGMLHVQRGMEVAIEAALGEVLNALVVRTEHEAIAAVGVLNEIEAGRLTFYVLEGLRGAHPLNLGSEPGVLGVASRFVRCEEEYRELFESLLGRMVVVEDLDGARRVVRRGLAAAVTLDGTILRPGGVVIGGAGKSGGYIFQAAGELEDLGLGVTALQKRQQASIDQVAELRAQADEAAAREETLELAAADLVRKIEAVDASSTSLRRRLAPLRGELEWIRSTDEEIATKLATADAALRDAQVQQAANTGTDVNRLAESAAAAEAELQILLNQQRDAGARLSEAQGHRAAVLREQAARDALWESSRRARQRTETSLASRRQSLEALMLDSSNTEKQIERMDDDLARIQAVVARSLEAIEPARRRVRQLAADQRLLVETVAAERATLGARERSRLDAEFAVARSEQELLRLQEQVAAEGLPPDLHLCEPAREGPETVCPSAEELEARVQSLRSRIRALGGVNAEAEADYRESRERHDFLAVQVADLREAEQSLIGALDQLRQIVRDQFRTTFQVVNADFQVYFRTFFGGGQARLVLTEPEDYGESGVDIVAQPPGKRLQNLAMLSGGERSMTAVALIFALLESNPAPFCVLDEVDAALDESNVGRFSEALTKLAQRGQFLVVTHNRGTVQAADNIYGISMTADGISSVLSMRLAEASPMLV